MNTVRLVTFNIRYDTADDGDNRYRCREASIVRKIRAEMPDLIGFQEMTETMMTSLDGALPEYLIVGCGREAGYGGERTAIACRKETVQLLALDVFWLSPEPDVPGSRYAGQSACPRNCTCAKVYHMPSQTAFRLYNTHLDHRSDQARVRGLAALRARIQTDQAAKLLPLFVTGDFNLEPDEEAYAAIPPLEDLTVLVPGTYHGFGTLKTPKKIDYILRSPTATPGTFACETWHAGEEGRLLSDHDAIILTWAW